MLGLDPGIHEAEQPTEPYGCHSQHFIMDCRVKPGNDAERMPLVYGENAALVFAQLHADALVDEL
jgi:hypothetical protein